MRPWMVGCVNQICAWQLVKSLTRVHFPTRASVDRVLDWLHNSRRSCSPAMPLEGVIPPC